MQLDQLKQGVIARGSVLPEPVQLMGFVLVGNEVKLMGKGLSTGLFRDPILSQDQLALLEVTPEREWDSNRFRLGIEPLRLALAYEYGPSIPERYSSGMTHRRRSST